MTALEAPLLIFMGLVGISGWLWGLHVLHLRHVIAPIRQHMEERLLDEQRRTRHLNDTLLQGFQGLTLKLQIIANQIPAELPTRGSLELSLDSADGLLANAREGMRDLHLAGSGGDLTESLFDTARTYTAHDATRFALVVEGRPRTLRASVRNELSRIGGSALRNAFEHSHADAIEAALVFDLREFRLCISDTGIGIGDALLSPHNGLRPSGLAGMRASAARIDAVLDVFSRPGSGTVIMIHVPASAAYLSEGIHETRPDRLN